MMIPIPSLPFLPSASLPEVVWVVLSLVGFWISMRAASRDRNPRIALKNGIRAVVSIVFLGDGLAAMFSAPAPSPTWLSVLTPMAFAFGAFAMALLSVIDEQAVTTSGG